jgi:L-threonylcarbamoyladenylate synthase
MQTLHLPATPANIQHAAQIIQAGGVVAFPTETVYGLGANAYDPQAVEKIFRAKGRPASDPLIVHLHDLAQWPAIADPIPPLAYDLAAQFWPGPLTMILPKTGVIPANVSAGLATVAVRMPAHPVALALLQAAGLPICAPSANLFTRPSPTTAAHVLQDLDGRIEAVLDAGPTPIGLESTILDLTQPIPTVLRPGGLTLEALRHVLPEVEVHLRYLAPEQGDQAMPAPGMLLKHYAPRAVLEVLQGPSARLLPALRERAQAHLAQGRRIGVMLPTADLATVSDLAVEQADLGPDAATMAARLFEALRQLDSANVEIILTVAVAADGLGMAIADRLLRAANGHFIQVV